MILDHFRLPFAFDAARSAGVLIGLMALLTGLHDGALFDQQLWMPQAIENVLTLAGAVAGASAVILAAARRHARTAFAAGVSCVVLIAFGLTASVAAAFMLLSCMALGDTIIGRSDRARSEPLIAAVLAILTGLAAYALATPLIVGYPVNTSLVYTVLLGIPIALNRSGLAAHADAFRTWIGERTQPGISAMFFGTAIVFVIALHAVHSAMPERYADALALHLLIATTVEALGRWHFDVGTHLWATMPMAGDFVFVIAHLLGGELSAKLINMALLLAIVGLLYALARRISGGTFAMGIACLFLSMPVAFIETATLFIENPLTAFILGGFAATTRLWPGAADYDSASRTVVAVFLMIGAAFATKLTGVILAGPIGLFALICLVRRNGIGKSLPTMAACATVVLLSCHAYVNAWLATGNPVFPLFNAVFRSPFLPAINFENPNYLATFTLDIFARIAFDSSRYMEAWNGASGFQFVLLGIATLAAALLRPRALTVLALAAGMLLVVAVSANTVYIRYLYPAFPLLLLGCAGLIRNETATGDRSWLGRSVDRSLHAVVAGAVVLNLMFLPSAAWILRNFDLDALFTLDGRHKVILRDAPDRALIDIVNAQYGTRARVGFMGHTITAGLQGTPLYGNWYNNGLNNQLFRVASTEMAVDLMRNFHMTHLILGLDVSYPGKIHMEAAARLHGREVARLGSAALFELNDDIRFGGKPLVQDSFDTGLGSWGAMNEDPASGTDGFMIRPGRTVLTKGGLHVGDYRTYLLSVRVQCDPSQHSVNFQMNWLDAGGQFLGVTSEALPCRPDPNGIVSSRQEAPTRAASAAAYISFGGNDPILIQEVLLHEGPMAANGLRPTRFPSPVSN